MRKCWKCLEVKSLDEFGTNKREYLSKRYVCKVCEKELNKNYRRTKEGVISKIYSHQKETSKRRGHNPPEYTKEELKEWLFSNDKFEELYNNWINSNYNKMDKPSIDRIDDKKGYSFDNIQLMTWRENKNKAMKDIRNCKIIHGNPQKKVYQIDKNGNTIKLHSSISNAARELKLSTAHISSVCKGIRKTTGGFLWKYAS